MKFQIQMNHLYFFVWVLSTKWHHLRTNHKLFSSFCIHKVFNLNYILIITPSDLKNRKSKIGGAPLKIKIEKNVEVNLKILNDVEKKW